MAPIQTDSKDTQRITSDIVSGRRIRIVVLQSPYDSLDETMTQELFSKMLALKIKGYQSREYPYGVMPADATDYVGTHLMVCQEWGGTLTPLFSQRSISMKRCLTHNLPYPVISTLKSSNAHEHARFSEEVIERCVSRKTRFCYESSMTTHPDVKKDPELLAAMRDLLRVVHIGYHSDAGTEEMLSLGAVKFKVDRTYFEFMGYQAAAGEQGMLPNFTVPSYFGAEAKLFHYTGRFSDQAMALLDRYRIFWDNRIVIPGKLEKEEAAQRRAA